MLDRMTAKAKKGSEPGADPRIRAFRRSDGPTTGSTL